MDAEAAGQEKKNVVRKQANGIIRPAPRVCLQQSVGEFEKCEIIIHELFPGSR